MFECMYEGKVYTNVYTYVCTYIQYCVSYFLLNAESLSRKRSLSHLRHLSAFPHCYCMLSIYYFTATELLYQYYYCIQYCIQFSILMYLKFMLCHVFFYSIIQLSYYIVNLYFMFVLAHFLHCNSLLSFSAKSQSSRLCWYLTILYI